MKTCVTTCVSTVLCVALGTSLLSAGEVDQGTLAALGLGGMQAASDAEGLQVRGKAGSVRIDGAGFVSLMLHDPSTGSTLMGHYEGNYHAFSSSVNAAAPAEVFADFQFGLPAGELGIATHSSTFNAGWSNLTFGGSGGAWAR